MILAKIIAHDCCVFAAKELQLLFRVIVYQLQVFLSVYCNITSAMRTQAKYDFRLFVFLSTVSRTNWLHANKARSFQN